MPEPSVALARHSVPEPSVASPLDRAGKDPIMVLALLVEACERGETTLRPYLDAAHAAIEYADAHPILVLPAWYTAPIPEELEEIVGESLSSLDPSPYQLYKETGGGQAYIDAMLAHGYLVKKEPKP